MKTNLSGALSGPGVKLPFCIDWSSIIMETYPAVIRRDLEKAETQSGYADFMQINLVFNNGKLMVAEEKTKTMYVLF